MKFPVLLAGLTAGFLAIAGAASAQTAALTPTDVKAIGSWTVRCFPVQSPSPCEMYEELADKTTHQRVVGISIAYIPSADRQVLQIAVPLGVSIPAGLVVKTDNFSTPKLAYRRCDQAGCYFENGIDNASVESLSHAGNNAAINIVADNGKPYSLAFYLNGFSEAHDAMVTLNKEKAKGTLAAPAAPAPAAPAK